MRCDLVQGRGFHCCIVSIVLFNIFLLLLLESLALICNILFIRFNILRIFFINLARLWGFIFVFCYINFKLKIA